MISVKFLLKKPNSKDSTLIYMKCYYGGKTPFKYSLSEKINPKFWNNTTQRVRIVAECPNAKAINLKIERYFREIENVYFNIESSDKSLNNYTLKEELNKRLNKNSNDGKGFLSVYKNLSQERNKQFVTTYNIMAKYLSSSDIDFNEITYQFYENFTKYLKNLGYSANYISSQIKNLKAVMNYAYKLGLHKNESFKSFAKHTEDVDNIYLNEDEIKKIYELPLKGYHDRARDLFIIGCCTALRYSDFTQIKPENIKGDFIYVTTQKTTERVIVPIHWMVKQLLNKYNNNLPKAISNQKLNDYLKLIGEKAGINDIVTKTRTEGGKKITRTFHKYELITTHTARRSAATNMYKSGVPTIAIMKITGHKTEAAFLKYIKISKEENAQMLASHAFFRG